MKISIITVCKNAEKTIEATIRSITQQTYKNIEYIIVDGKSRDNTLKIIKRNRINISNLISESDAGVYDAMNKGIQLATGEYLLFLNADDILLHPTTIECFVDNILKYSLGASDVLYGKIIIYNSKDGHGSIWGSRHISNYQLYCSSIPHPARFFHKNAFEKNGLYSTKFQIAGDYEWYVRALVKNRLNFKKTKQIVSIFCEGGLSTRPELADIMNRERKMVQVKYYKKKYLIIFKFRRRLKKLFGI